MSIQYVSLLPILKKLFIGIRKQFLVNSSKNFILFLGGCLVKLLRGELQDLQNKVLYKKEKFFQVQKRVAIDMYYHTFCHSKIEIVWNSLEQFVLNLY